MGEAISTSKTDLLDDARVFGGLNDSCIERIVGSTMILDRYRVFKPIQVDDSNKGVFLAYDFGAKSKETRDKSLSCVNPQEVIVKAWYLDSPSPFPKPDPGFFDYGYRAECRRESLAYDKICRGQKDPNRFELYIGLPAVLANAYDPTPDLQAIVLEKLGPTLEDLRCRLPNKCFTEQMVLAAAIQLLDQYSILHSFGIIHHGIDSSNICISPNSKRTKTLYLINFSYSFLIDLKKINPLPEEVPKIFGYRTFLSVLGHRFSQSQRDDLESLAYLLVRLSRRFLPWMNGSSSSEMRIRKAAVSAKELFGDMDNSFVEFWKDVRILGYAEVPDYAKMKSRFEDCWKRRNYEGISGEFDWWSIMEDRTEEASEPKEPLKIEGVLPVNLDGLAPRSDATPQVNQ